MRHDRLVKQVEKYATVVKGDRTPVQPHDYSAICGNYMIEWYLNYDKETIATLTVRHLKDNDDFCSDHFAGSFYHTIKSAIYNLTYDLRTKQTA